MKKSAFLLLAFACCSLNAQDFSGKIRVYGEVSNYVSYQTRVGYTDNLGLYYLLPADQNLNEIGLDMNKVGSAQFLNLASRIGVEWAGYRYKGFELGARIEGDFFAVGSNNTTAFRLREAYFTADLDLTHRSAGHVRFLAGQSIHPMAKDKPSTISLSCGAPFNPYGFAPQISIGYRPLNWLDIEFAALWQSEFCSTGPDGISGNYIKWGKTPEFYSALTFSTIGITAKLGVDFLTIKPRFSGNFPYTTVEVPVKDRLKAFTAFAYLEYVRDRFEVKAKTILGESGEHLLMIGGYGIHRFWDENGTRYYTPYRSSSSWISLSYGGSLKGSLMAGYYKNLGTRDTLYSVGGIYFNNDCFNINDAFRIAPSVRYDLKHFSAGFEYEYTNASYGDTYSIDLTNGLCTGNVRRLFSHRFSLLLSCTF